MWLNNISLYGYIIFCLCLSLMDIWFVSTLLLFWIMLIWAFICEFLFGHIFLFLLGIYQGVELLTLCLNLWIISKLFSKVASLCYILIHFTRVLIFPHACKHWLLSVFFTLTILVCLKWYVTMVFICISLMTNDFEPLFLCMLAICISSVD